MKILLVHNSYQLPGGEDQVFAQETELLRGRGHQVLVYRASNDQAKGQNPLVTAANTIWNQRAHRELRRLMQREKPDIVHVHNTFQVISPPSTMQPRRKEFRSYKLCTTTVCFVPRALSFAMEMYVRTASASRYRGPASCMAAIAAAGWPRLR